ncbi:hypothetical protein L1987_31629 [Smallanthus sonchifolius]|uniref:Uncharacterized protein n=1 Tax=Smallanthus sonchifolius TaxID=185202 RepID=A0ACB9I6Q9_9ASTR|nr:hypothetical protein L1987_31629 [Smallanthus sonchifolius]
MDVSIEKFSLLVRHTSCVTCFHLLLLFAALVEKTDFIFTTPKRTLFNNTIESFFAPISLFFLKANG